MINYEPKVGEILQCQFGTFELDANGKPVQYGSSDRRLMPEMIKNRLVVVLNAKIHDACIVVPLSSVEDKSKLQRGWHVRVAPELIKETGYFDATERWAKADHCQQVSRQRLRRLDGGKQFLPNATVESVQIAVIKSISAGSLLKPKPELEKKVPETKPEAANDTISATGS